MSDSNEPEVGQALVIELFDETGRRLHLQGRLTGSDDNGLVMSLEGGDAVLAVKAGSRALVEYSGKRGTHQFMTTVVRTQLSRGFQMVVEHPDRVTLMQKRRFTRHFLSVPASYELVEGPASARSRRSARTQELAASGACLLVERPVAVGAVMRVEFDFKELGTCAGQAQVRYCKRPKEAGSEPFQCGIEFTQMDSRDLARLSDFLRSIKRRS